MMGDMRPNDAEHRRLTASLLELQQQTPTYPTKYLFVLMAITAIDSSDRALLSVVFEDVRRAFDVSDAQLGLLVAAYSALATASALPFGFLADRVNRVRLIALGFIPWAIAQFASAAAGTFAVLFVARMFLGTIEATNGPSTPSLIGDYYPPARRSRALAMSAAGALIGTFLGFAVGGALAGALGWRQAFVIFGVAGLVAGLVVVKVLPEPQRGLQDALHRAQLEVAEAEGLSSVAAGDTADGDTVLRLDAPDLDVAGTALISGIPTTDLILDGQTTDVQATDIDYRHLSARQAIGRLARIPTMWILLAASGANDFFTSALVTWVATFFRRYHGLSAGEAGSLIGLFSLAVVGGIVVGGRLGDRFSDRGRPTDRIVFLAVGSVVQLFFFFGMFTLDLGPATVSTFFVSFTTGMLVAPASAVLLDVVVAHLRGRAAAVRAILRVVSTAAAPVVFGLISDAYGLRSAWLYTMPVLLVSAAVTLLALRTYRRDMSFAQLESLRQHRLERPEAT